MKVTYHGIPGRRIHEEIVGMTFEMPDDTKVSFGTTLRHEGVSYSVTWCECSVEYDDPRLNEMYRVIPKEKKA